MAQQQITLRGNLTADPELRFTPAGSAVVSGTVAVNNGYRDSEGVWQDGEPLFQRFVAWRDLAEHVAESVHRGDPVLVTGRLVSRSYQDKQLSEKAGEDVMKYVTELVADDVAVSLSRATATVRRIRRDGAAAAAAAAWGGTETTAPAPNGVHREPVAAGL